MMFQFQNRDESLGDDCSIPHWINLRFFFIYYIYIQFFINNYIIINKISFVLTI